MTRFVLSIACGLVSLGAAAAVTPDAAPASNLTASQIVERNVAARGGLEAWRKVSTLTMTGQLEAGGKANTALPFVMKMKRPHKSRLEITFKEQTAFQVYDGTQGWKVRPFLNRNEVEPYAPAEAKSAAAWEELDGPLVDHAAKGTKVESAGTEAVEGKNTYKLKLTMKGGEQRYLWIDAQTFLELKVEGQPRKMDGKMKKVAILYRDYRPVAGLTMPHLLETVVEGVKQSHKLNVARVVVNEPLQDTLFQKPQLNVANASVR